MPDFYTQVAKQLDQQVSQLVKTISRRAITPIQTSDETQLQQLASTLSTLTQTARDSFVWRCGLVTVCADDPGCLTDDAVSEIPLSSSSNNNDDSNGTNNSNNNNNNNNTSSAATTKITPLDSRISVISRLTDLLSTVYVAHSYFTSGKSEHGIVFKNSQVVTLFAVLSGSVDVPFLTQPLCASVLESLNAVIQDFLGVVHAEHSVNNSLPSSSSSTSKKKNPNSSSVNNRGMDRRKFPRKLPMTFSIHAHRYLLKSLSRRIFQPLYASWLISALGSPETLSPFPGSSSNSNHNKSSGHHQNDSSSSASNNNNSSLHNKTTTNNNTSLANPFNNSNIQQGLLRTINKSSNNNNPTQASFSSSSTTTTGLPRPVTTDGDENYHNNKNKDVAMVVKDDDDEEEEIQDQQQRSNHDDDDDDQKFLRKARSGMNSHSCFLKDGIVRIICGGFLGDGPSASPHSYVAIALNVLSMILLTPLEDDHQSSTVVNNNSSSSSSSSLDNSTTTTTYDRRASQIFGAKSVEGIATITEALVRRTIFRGKQQQQQQPANQQNQGHLAATTIMNSSSPSSARRLMRFFWALRPLIQSLSSCPLTKNSFLNNDSTRHLFDMLWKTIAAMTEVIDSVLVTARRNHQNSGNVDDDDESSDFITVKSHPDASVSFVTKTKEDTLNKQQQQQAKLLQAVTVMTFSVLPLATSLWKGIVNTNNNNNSTAQMMSRNFSETIFLFARKAALILVPPPCAAAAAGGNNSNNSRNSCYTPSSQEMLIAFDSLVSSVEFAASTETTPSLNSWLKDASSTVTSIHIQQQSQQVDNQASISVAASSSNFHIQSQWSTLLLTLGIDDTILRCLFASTIGRSPESELPAHLINFLELVEATTDGSNDGSTGGDQSSSATMMMSVVVDTSLRDAVTHDGEKLPTSRATPDHIFGALSAVSGSPLYGSSSSSSSFMPNPILKRALLKIASLAADEVSCRDVCRVLLRSDQSICPISWSGSGGVLLSSSSNDESAQQGMMTRMNTSNSNSNSALMMMNNSSSIFNNSNTTGRDYNNQNYNNNHNHNHNHNSSLSSESGLSASLRIELAQEKSLNFDLQRELQKRSNEASVQDAKIRALHETINSMEAECNQQQRAAEVMREMLEKERQSKQQLYQSENEMRSEYSAMAQRIRQLEMEKERIEGEAQARIHEAEQRANSVVGQVSQMERELHQTREKLTASEEKVTRYVQLHNTFNEMSKGFK